jgi:uncharacterized membrane protein YfcA
MATVAIISALAMGFVLGLLGGGGSILAVPILVYLVGAEAKVAIATSLLVVGATSVVAAISHARAGNVNWRVGLIFGAFAMGGAFLGGLLAKFIPGNVLLILFAVLMLVTAIAMLRGKKEGKESEATAAKSLPIPKIALEGLVVGGVTGMVGAGGGFLVVPALVLLGGLPMRQAIGTSLLVISMKSFAGYAGYAGHVETDMALVLPFVAASVVGTVIGTQAARVIEAAKLRTAFAWFVLVMGVFLLAQKVGIIPNAADHHAPVEEHASSEQSRA